MHAKFLGSTRRRIVSVFGMFAVLLGVSFGAASLASAAGAQNKLCAKNASRELTVFSGSCPAGYFAAQLAASDVYGLGSTAAAPSGPSKAEVQAMIDAAVAKQVAAAPQAGLQVISATLNAAVGKKATAELVVPAKAKIVSASDLGVATTAPGGPAGPARAVGVDRTFTLTLDNATSPATVPLSVNAWILVRLG